MTGIRYIMAGTEGGDQTASAIFSGIWKNRPLLLGLVVRDLQAKFRGSLLGSAWNFLFPVLSVLTYTFVFGSVLQSRWTSSDEHTVSFALVLFCGLALFQAFQDILIRSPAVMLSQPSLVKKVVFPLQILPLVSVLSSGASLFLSLTIACIGLLFLGGGSVHWLWIPIILVPLFVVMLGLAWFLSGVGTFMRDIGPMIAAGTPLLLFLTPIFYPLSKTGKAGYLLALNPLACAVENLRNVLTGEKLSMPLMIWLYTSAILIMMIGYQTFRRTRPYFADVV